jgi:hypothetical protein
MGPAIEGGLASAIQMALAWEVIFVRFGMGIIPM